MAAPCQTSSAEKACTCRSGSSALIARQMSRYVSPVKAGWMPPWRQTSTAPRSQASRERRTISSSGTRYGLPAQVRRQLALREGAEAAAEVADVRVVDVPRDDVGDRVAADLAAKRVGRARPRAAGPRPRASKSAVTSSSSSSASSRTFASASATGRRGRPRVRRSRGGARTSRRPAAQTDVAREAGRVRLPADRLRRRAGRSSARGRRRTRGRWEAGGRARSRGPRWPRAGARSRATAPPGSRGRSSPARRRPSRRSRPRAGAGKSS